MNCPDCNSHKIVKNGSLTNGKQKYKCKDCGRQFVLNPKKQAISDETKALIDKLILERVSLAGIARVTGVSERWVQNYANNKYENVSKTRRFKKKVNDS